MTQTILILLITQLFAMMSPGPDMMLVIKNTLGQTGKKAAVYTILGIGLGLSVHITLSIGGLAVILTQSNLVYKTVRYAGAAYLAYLGVKALFAKIDLTLNDSNLTKSKPPAVAFREGLLTNLTNPKVTLFILSLFTQLIDPTSPFWHKITFGVLLVAQAIIVWLVFSTLVGLPATRGYGRQWAVWMDRIFGLILIGIAASVVFLG
jgi:RhtB (resistance to homoserine/threonine) family protein